MRGPGPLHCQAPLISDSSKHMLLLWCVLKSEVETSRFYFVAFSSETVSLHRPVWPGICDLPVSAWGVLGLQRATPSPAAVEGVSFI
jgi:hypothetical protein